MTGPELFVITELECSLSIFVTSFVVQLVLRSICSFCLLLLIYLTCQTRISMIESDWLTKFSFYTFFYFPCFIRILSFSVFLSLSFAFFFSSPLVLTLIFFFCIISISVFFNSLFCLFLLLSFSFFVLPTFFSFLFFLLPTFFSFFSFFSFSYFIFMFFSFYVLPILSFFFFLCFFTLQEQGKFF